MPLVPSFRAAWRAAPRTLALTVLLASVASAQPRTADPAVRGIPLASFPRLVPLAPGVYGYEEIRAPGFTTVSLIVVGDSGVLIADGQGSPAATQRMLEEIRAITPRPVRWYVVGSDHGDHTAGNSELPAGITWIVHPTARRQLQQDAAAAAAVAARAADTVAGASRPPARLVVVPPNAMAGDREQVDVGGRVVEVHFLGRAHTGGDLMVYVPGEKILFMSEAYLNRVFPAMRSAYPDEWVRTIERALAMDVTRFVPGHGFIEAPDVSREELVAFRDALQAVIAEVRRLHARRLPVDAAIRQADWGAYRDWFLAEQQGPIAVRRVYLALDGALPRPDR
ncbi:MAG: MBL fold metallo-hydrolase [Gemmatimonadaceae bacterium]|nr:MBL fold metallo-hydrolase [Gemmatimonadaceae bacterium]